MKISRRDFLKFCGVSAAALGLTALDLGRLREVLANPDGSDRHLAAGSGVHGMHGISPEQDFLVPRRAPDRGRLADCLDQSLLSSYAYGPRR